MTLTNLVQGLVIMIGRLPPSNKESQPNVEAIKKSLQELEKWIT